MASGIALIVGIFLVGGSIVALLFRSILRGKGRRKERGRRGRRRSRVSRGSAAEAEPDESHDAGVLRQRAAGVDAPRAEGDAWYLPPEQPDAKEEPPANARPTRGSGRYYDPNARQDPRERKERPYYMPTHSGPRTPKDDDEDGYRYD